MRRSPAAQNYRAWYRTTRWKALRLAHLKAEPFCRYCRDRGERTRATVCDHVERHGGNEVRFWAGPFQSLCKADHDASKQREEARGFSCEVADDGWPVDKRHPANSGRLLQRSGKP
jgi:5-methylcytosine-specific restriction enzyme A